MHVSNNIIEPCMRVGLEFQALVPEMGTPGTISSNHIVIKVNKFLHVHVPNVMHTIIMYSAPDILKIKSIKAAYHVYPSTHSYMITVAITSVFMPECLFSKVRPIWSFAWSKTNSGVDQSNHSGSISVQDFVFNTVECFRVIFCT